jgi:hypothetical protein
MKAPRKTSPGSTSTVPTSRAGDEQAARALKHFNADALLIAASGLTLQSILIVTRDEAGVLRVWHTPDNPLENLRLAEYARGELSVSMLCEKHGA